MHFREPGVLYLVPQMPYERFTLQGQEAGWPIGCRQHCLDVLSNRRDLPEAQHFNRRKSLPRGHASGRDENRSTSEGSPIARRNELYLQLWHAPSSRNQPRFCFPIELHMRAHEQFYLLKAPANWETLLRKHVSPFARERRISCGNIFCFRETENVSDFFQKPFVSATNVSPFAREETMLTGFCGHVGSIS